MTEELNRIIENLINDGVIQMQAENQSATYIFSVQPESDDVVLISHKQEPSWSSSQNESVNCTQYGDGEVTNGSAISELNSNIEQDPMDAVWKVITSLNFFWKV